MDLERILRGRDPDLRTASGDEECAALWAGRLAAMHAFKATGMEVFVCDATVPRQRLPEMVERARQIAARLGLDIATVGHAGDGNLHPTILYAPEELATVDAGASQIASAALDLGGTLTGEHGIGTAKLGQMRRSFGAVELAAFRAIKCAFDPGGVLNPGVMLPPPERDEPELGAFGKAVVAALTGRMPTVPPSVPDGARDRAVRVDAENMTLTVGGGASCRQAAETVANAGLSCPTLETDGLVAEVIESAGNHQPARAALLGIEATLPGEHHARFGSAAMKDVAGLDAKRLVAGGRGAFGRVERVILRAMPHRR